jgi:DinB superfamily
MKKLAFLIFACAPLVFAADGSMTSVERSYLLDLLETSKKGVLASIQGLSDAQWKYKPAPTVWSVQECAEHIILAEDYIFGSSQQVLKAPAVQRPETSNAEADHKLVAMIQDRSQKATAPEPIVPSAKYATAAEAAREFTARRDKTIAYVKSTNDDLRVHAAPGPVGTMDAYQLLLLLGSHSVRHTLQIKEVQSNTAYPKPSAR